MRAGLRQRARRDARLQKALADHRDALRLGRCDLGGLLGGGLLSALLGKKLLLVFLGITAFLVVTAFGLSFTIGKRSLDESASRAIKGISPYMTEGNLVFLADFVRNAIEKFD